jgi:hypothetical protein
MDSHEIFDVLTSSTFNLICDNSDRSKAYKFQLSPTQWIYVKNSKKNSDSPDTTSVKKRPLVIHPKTLVNADALSRIEGIRGDLSENGLVKSSGYDEFPKSDDGTENAGLAIDVDSPESLEKLLNFLKGGDKNFPIGGKQTLEQLAQPLENLKTKSTYFEQDIDGVSSNSKVDEIVLQSIKTRRGQPAFRRALLAAFNSTCCVTGCTVQAILEAAHIVPHGNESNYNVYNGLLLRADIHILFDLGLLQISECGIVRIACTLKKSEYGEYDGIRILEGELPGELKDNLSARQRYVYA